MITSEPVLVMEDPISSQSSALAISQGLDFDPDITETVVPSASIFFPQISAGGEVLPPKMLARKYIGTKSSFFPPQSPFLAQLPELTLN